VTRAKPDIQVKQWAVKIAASWNQSVTSIFETGRLVGKAKTALKDGDRFGDLIGNDEKRGILPFKYNTAYRLMAIAEDTRLWRMRQKLPASWMTLYELTKLSDEELAFGFKEKLIDPDMERYRDTSLIKSVAAAANAAKAHAASDTADDATGSADGDPASTTDPGSDDSGGDSEPTTENNVDALFKLMIEHQNKFVELFASERARDPDINRAVEAATDIRDRLARRLAHEEPSVSPADAERDRVKAIADRAEARSKAKAA
jgi:hypothetical protein